MGIFRKQTTRAPLTTGQNLMQRTNKIRRIRTTAAPGMG